MFTQILDPTGNLFVTWLIALIPVALLLFLLAGLRMSAWLAVLIGSIVTFLLGLWVWKMPFGDGLLAYAYGSATGVWNVDWITFWGVILFNTLVTTGAFEKLRRWLIQQGTRDVRVHQRRPLPPAAIFRGAPENRVAREGIAAVALLQKQAGIIRHQSCDAAARCLEFYRHRNRPTVILD